MAKRREIHTVPKGSGWANVSGGEVVSSHRRKDTAQEAGRDWARGHAAEHVVHNRDGKISGSNSYGSDPLPPRDKR
jgi:hypothetical protein